MVKKIWKAIQGYKRQAGAVIVILPTMLQQLGVNDSTSLKVITVTQIAGMIIWGIGATDAAIRKIGK